MQPVLSSAAMRAADEAAISGLGIPGFALMETAGREAARLADEFLDGPSRILVCCGKGNHGGDGLVLARWLLDAGHTVDVRVAGSNTSLSADSLQNLRILERISSAHPELPLTITLDWDGSDNLPGADLIVDALFGTGLSTALRAPFDRIVEAMNAHQAPIVALDLPSGLSADSGMALGACIQARMTVTMGALKTGLLLGDGPELAGQIHTAGIGIPLRTLQSFAREAGCGFLSTDTWVRAHLRPRTRQDHKYTTGPTLVVGGSDAFPGAPVLAARAAARMGSGYVVAAGPHAIHGQLVDKLDAIPVAGFDERQPEQLIETLETRWSKATALLVGPGLGRSEQRTTFLMTLLESFKGPVVLDADALWAVADQRERIAALSRGQWILTPHEGEAKRLGSPASAFRVEWASNLAQEWNCVVLLKGQPSVTASPDGHVVINATGHPAAATAGTGDVLAGMVAGLLAQGLEPLVAAAAGIHVGGTAAACFVEGGASQSLVATDLIETLPDVLRSLS